MKVLELGITRTVHEKAVPSSLSSVYGRGGWFPLIVHEPTTGAWQRNQECRPETVLSHAAVFACVKLIASDIGKLRPKLVEQDRNGIWTEIESPSFSPVLRKPNHFQTRIQFYAHWIAMKLIHGNTYVLKQRDNRGVVIAQYVLDSTVVRPMVASNGDVYYAIQQDSLSRVTADSDDLIVPASEIIHDRMNTTFFHPLIGLSPITACGLAALQGLSVQRTSEQFFGQGAQPGALLINKTPGGLDPAQEIELEKKWNSGFSGINAGKIAVLTGEFDFKQLQMTAVDSQLIEQLKWTAENVCMAFNVPAYMIGAGPPPNYNNIEALNQQYYSQCLQELIESMELLLDEGLGLAPEKIEGRRLGVEFDLDDLLRMDTASRVKAASDSIRAGMTPNEIRFRFHDLGPVPGGDNVFMQEQDHSLEALARRDARPDPFAKEPKQLPKPSRTESEELPTKEWARSRRSYFKEKAAARLRTYAVT